MKRKITAIAVLCGFCIMLSACNTANRTTDGGEITTSEITESSAGESAETESVETQIETVLPESEKMMITDREGNEIEVPEQIDTVISAAPSVTEILEGLGLADKIIAADTYSSDIEGIDPSICTLDFYNLNTEELIALAPDVIIINGISDTGSADPYADLKAAGTDVVYIPSAESLDGIKADIRFLAAYTKTEDKGEEMINDINNAITYFTEKAASIAEKKKVYFEVGAAPYLYTTGSGTYLNEIIELIGAENIYAGESGWLSNSEETVIAADPDVIITNVNYEGYDFNEIYSRPGWENIKAIQNKNVYSVGSNATSRASQHIVDGIAEIAYAVYPELREENPAV